MIFSRYTATTRVNSGKSAILKPLQGDNCSGPEMIFVRAIHALCSGVADACVRCVRTTEQLREGHAESSGNDFEIHQA